MKMLMITAAAVLVSGAGEAYAQESYVVRGGSGSTCSYQAPCEMMFTARSALGTTTGTVYALSDGFYGGLSMFGFPYGFSFEGTGSGTFINGYSVSSPSTLNLALKGASLHGTGTFQAPGSMLIEDVTFRRTGPFGFYFAPQGAASLTIRNSAFHDASVGAGAAIQIVTGGHNVNVTLDNVKVSGGIRGIVIDTSGGGWAKVNIENSSFTNITGPAIYGNAGSGNIRLYLDNVSATNSNVGVVMAGANALAWMTQSKIAGNATGIQQAAGAKIYSYKDNQIFNNGTDGTPLPASPSPVQSMPGGEIASVLR